jgi:hypothetical protein
VRRDFPRQLYIVQTVTAASINSCEEEINVVHPRKRQE